MTRKREENLFCGKEPLRKCRNLIRFYDEVPPSASIRYTKLIGGGGQLRGSGAVAPSRLDPNVLEKEVVQFHWHL